MTNPCAFKSLLPHATPVELALEEEASRKYCRANPDIIKALHDPWTCPVEFLPWLAYALSVDVWNPRWPEQTRRSVCANALNIHLHKGTRGGLENALAALGVRTEVVEWWEMEPRSEPGTIDLMLWVRDNILPEAEVIFGAELIADIRRKIERTKRASIHYSFKLGAELTAQLSSAYSLHTATHMMTDAVYRNPAVVAKPTRLSMANSIHAATVTHVGAHNQRTNTRSFTRLITAFSLQITTMTRLNLTGVPA